MTRWTRPLFAGLIAGALVVSGQLQPGSASPASPRTTAPSAEPPTKAQRPEWQVSGLVYTSVVTRTRIYLGGDFTSITNVATRETLTRHNLVAFNRSTGRILRDWRPTTDGAVRTLASSPSHDQLFVGGAFQRINGHSRTHIGVVSLATGHTTAWTGAASGTVRDILVRRDRAYVAGVFRRFNGQPHRGLAAVRRVGGGLIPGWRGRIGQARALALAVTPKTHALVVGGAFSTLSGRPRSFLGSVHVSDGTTTGWRPKAECPTCQVLDLDSDGRRVYASMAGPGGRVLAYSIGSNNSRWRAKTNGNVQALDLYEELVVIGGHFSRAKGIERSQVAGAERSHRQARLLRTAGSPTDAARRVRGQGRDRLHPDWGRVPWRRPAQGTRLCRATNAVM